MRCSLAHVGDYGSVRFMRELLILAINLLIIFPKLLRPRGVRAVAAESLLLKHQLLISNRCRQRAANLRGIGKSIWPRNLDGPSARRNPVPEQASRIPYNASYVNFVPLRAPGGGRSVRV